MQGQIIQQRKATFLCFLWNKGWSRRPYKLLLFTSIKEMKWRTC